MRVKYTSENIPNVYFAYDAQGDEDAEARRAKKTSRPQSARRPKTARFSMFLSFAFRAVFGRATFPLANRTITAKYIYIYI